MVQQNADRVNPKTHGTIRLDPDRRWVVTDTTGALVGIVPTTSDLDVDEYVQALALLGLRRPFELNQALSSALVREGWDDADPWGSAMLALGSLCDVAHVSGATIPDSAGYRPAMGLRTADDLDVSEETGDARAQYLLADLENGSVTLGDIERAIKTLSRYLDLPGVRAGRY